MVVLSGLDHGTYCFELMAVSVSGDKSINNTEAHIRVVAPFHRRPIFYEIIIGSGALFVFFLFQFRTKTLRRSNRILREKEENAKEVLRQKNLLSSRNKSIEDSLKYAHRIQQAMFTNEKEILRMFPRSFILQKPKDIVSGDFFWAKRVENRIFLAAVDCTGHGVPGAFMSLIGLEFFRQIISINKVFKPSEILNQLNNSFDELFGGDHDISLKDGMDVSLCSFDLENRTLEYAGAFHPLYIVRNGELMVIKGDKTTIGPNIGFQRLPFNNHEVYLKKDDMIYLFSDGYADQFGGPEEKKFKYRRFRHLLLSVYEKPVEVQHQMLESSINDWRGNLEQVDDILVIGVRISRINGSFRD
jgi:serine phosphatase RsbU (regulator of sigma subunit)